MKSEEQIRDLLREECELAGSQKAWADANGLSEVHVSDILRARRQPGEKILAALGYRKVVGFVRDGV